MNVKELITGLEILMPHYDKPGGYHIGAEHDVIYAYATQTPLSALEIDKLRELGWFQEDSPDEYELDEGWAAYT